MRKVVWLDRRQTAAFTAAVLLSVGLLSAFIAALDWLLSRALGLILRVS
jgi:preprotein translocase SecE subunit